MGHWYQNFIARNSCFTEQYYSHPNLQQKIQPRNSFIQKIEFIKI